MTDTFGVAASRMVGLLYGTISTLGGVVMFVLFVRIPIDLLHLLPAGVARAILNVAPWLVAAGTGRPSGTKLLAVSLAAAVFVVYGLWALRKALFGSADSLSASIGRDDGDGGD